MLARKISADHIYLACGHTDMRKSIDGLASIVFSHFKMDPHQRRKKQGGHLAEILKDFPHEEQVITLPEDQRVCKRCGVPLTFMGKEKICTEVQFMPATIKVIDLYRETFQCLECRKQDHFSIEKPVMPQPVLAKSIASPSSTAHVICQKYLLLPVVEWMHIHLLQLPVYL